MNQPKRIAIVVGETSGDILGSNLLKHLKERYPDAIYEGIGGPLMEDQGFHSLYPMERLSVMGLVEVLGRLWELLGIRKSLKQRWTTTHRPDLMVGIDAPDFTLNLELSLREQGIKTAHYVSPSVWAWRQGRVKKIARAVDKMLTLFPFEAEFYQDHNVDVTCVGHTLADQIPLQVDTLSNRSELGLETDARYLAVLPGSREGEVGKLMPVFVQVMETLLQQDQNLKFIIPAANESRHQQINEMLESSTVKSATQLIKGQSRTVMAAADAILIASGTATLEAALLKKPMVVAYKVNAVTAFILRRLLTQQFVSLPNLLAGKELVAERLQEEAIPEILVPEIQKVLYEDNKREALIQEFTRIHQSLKLDAGAKAANALQELIERKNGQ